MPLRPMVAFLECDGFLGFAVAAEGIPGCREWWIIAFYNFLCFPGCQAPDGESVRGACRHLELIITPGWFVSVSSPLRMRDVLWNGTVSGLRRGLIWLLD